MCWLIFRDFPCQGLFKIRMQSWLNSNVQITFLNFSLLLLVQRVSNLFVTALHSEKTISSSLKNAAWETIFLLGFGLWISSAVDGRNPAPPGMYETLWIMGYVPYQLVQDFFHQQYVSFRRVFPKAAESRLFLPTQPSFGLLLVDVEGISSCWRWQHSCIV